METQGLLQATRSDGLLSRAEFPRDSPAETWSWGSYSFAIRAFNVMAFVHLGPYLTVLAKEVAAADGGSAEDVSLAGIPVSYKSFFVYCVGISLFFQFLLCPLIGVITDYTPTRKYVLFAFTMIAVIATANLVWVDDDRYWLGGLLFVIGNAAYGVCAMLYNAFLPEIASLPNRNKVSAFGIAAGAVGSGIVLCVYLVYSHYTAALGGHNWVVRLFFFTCAVWWLAFSAFLFFFVKLRPPAKSKGANEAYVVAAFRQLWLTLKTVHHLPNTFKYLLSFMLYIDAIVALGAFANVYATLVLKLSLHRLTLIALMESPMILFGSSLFFFLSRRWGTKPALYTSIGCSICNNLYIVLFLEEEWEWWFINAIEAACIGGALGLWRGVYTTMIPPGAEAEFFAFYVVFTRLSAGVGPAMVGAVNQLTDSLRTGMIVVVFFYFLSFVTLPLANTERALVEATEYSDRVERERAVRA